MNNSKKLAKNGGIGSEKQSKGSEIGRAHV